MQCSEAMASGGQIATDANKAAMALDTRDCVVLAKEATEIPEVRLGSTGRAKGGEGRNNSKFYANTKYRDTNNDWQPTQ